MKALWFSPWWNFQRVFTVGELLSKWASPTNISIRTDFKFEGYGFVRSFLEMFARGRLGLSKEEKKV